MRAEALAALEKKREKARVKAMRLELELAEERRLTAERLRREAAMRARLEADPRVEALLAFRQAGKPVNDAVAEVERRFSDRPQGHANDNRGRRSC